MRRKGPKAVAQPSSTDQSTVFAPATFAPATFSPASEGTPPWGSRSNAGLDILAAPETDGVAVRHQTPAFDAPSAATGSFTTSDRAVIELTDVAKVYATGSLSVRALNGISLRIEEGEYVAIMGPSGSGKSTLMHIIGCLDVLSEGAYHLSGEDVSEMDEVELAQIRNRRIGFVFQQFNLLPSLTAWRNVELPMIYSGTPRALRRARAVEALRRVGLGDRMNHRPGELSGGQQQRVAVARALVGDPALILADEPTGNLDSIATEDALSLFDELHQQGRTIVLITHELDVAERARRIVRVRDGVITSDSNDPDVRRRPVPVGAPDGTAGT